MASGFLKRRGDGYVSARRGLGLAVLLLLSLAACRHASAPATTTLPAVPAAVAPTATVAPPARAFRHPGVVVTRAQLDLVKARVAAGSAPWAAAFEKTAGHFGALDYHATPFALVECGPSSNPNIGCTQEREDAIASYTHALRWYVTGDAAHARKAIEIMNAWSAVLKGHENHNAPLQSAWSAALWTRAAEIVLHTYDGWMEPDVARFRTMLRDAYLPQIAGGSPLFNGNWELTMIEAMMGIAVFNDDRPTFDAAVSMWRKRVPAYVYMEADGPSPVPPPGGQHDARDSLLKLWYGQETLRDGVAQETCRDLEHVSYGFASIAYAAETARIQGVDLYEEESARLRAGLELHARLLVGEAAPEWLCGGKVDRGRHSNETWEVAYNHYANRKGFDLPYTRRWVEQNRPTGAFLHMAWETLTHAEAR